MLKTLITSSAMTAIVLSVPALAQPVSPTEDLNNKQVEEIQAQHGMLTNDAAVEEAKHEYKEAVEDEVDELNEIASILIDAEELYTDAANLPDGDDEVREHLVALSAERAEQREEIQQLVIDKGAEPDTYGEALGTAHRAFAQLRTTVSEDSVVALEEVLRGEKYIVDEINARLEGDDVMSPEALHLLHMIKMDVSASVEKLEAKLGEA